MTSPAHSIPSTSTGQPPTTTLAPAAGPDRSLFSSNSTMKLFRLDFGIKDRYRRGLADTSSRMHRSPQSETDPRHLAASPSSPSALFSAIASTSHARDEPMEQWNQFGSSALEAANAQPQTHRSHSRGSNIGGRGHHGQDNGYDDDQEDDHASDGYMSSSSSSSLGSGSLASCSSLSPSSSDDDDDDCGDEDDDMQGGGGGGGLSSGSAGNDYYSGDHDDTQENDLSGSNGQHARQRVHFDYYGGRREMNEHGGLLPAAPIPAIEPLSDREALEQEARRRRLERHADKRRKSLNGSQAPPPLLLELIREEAEKERIQQPVEDEEDEDDEDDDDGDGDEEDDDDDDEDDDENEENEKDEDEDEDENGVEEESDEDDSGHNGHCSDDRHDSSFMDESDNDRDGDEHDFYRGYRQYLPQARDYSGDEEGTEEEKTGAATGWYHQYDYGDRVDVMLSNVDDVYSEPVHPLALPPGRHNIHNASSSAMGGDDNFRHIAVSHRSSTLMDSEVMSSNPAHAFTASPVLEDPSSYHMLPAVIAHYWKKLTHPSDPSPKDSCPSSSNSSLSSASSLPPTELP
ncbi:hypothetical protein EC968_006613 [Mortierella alpina]|nr:hypothetical protein EC968_006613 [Mortierella alpina]